MGCLGNLLWFIFGGFISGLSWTLTGCLWCITIIGIPVGMQCFKFAALSFFPFGKEVRYGGGAGSFLLNLIWLIVSGLPLAIESALIGVVLCITVIGIPFGLQQFKLAKLALMPFGSEVYYSWSFRESVRGKRVRRWKRNGPRLRRARRVSWNGRRKRGRRSSIRSWTG